MTDLCSQWLGTDSRFYMGTLLMINLLTHLSVLLGPALRRVLRQEVQPGAGQQVAPRLVLPQ